MKIFFLTFGAPTKNYHEAVERLCNQAKQMDIFDEIIGMTEKDLQNDEEFWSKHCDFINNNSRGYGYWIWKPYIIKKTFKKMVDDDILLYLDCGCELNYLAIDEFRAKINLVKNKQILGSSACLEKSWNKIELINYLGMNDNKYLNTTQNAATQILILKNNFTLKLICEWFEICENYNLINDITSINEEYKEFKEHRHDQAVFSLLSKKYNCCNYDLDPTWISNFNDINKFNNYTKNWPIWAARNKTGNSILENLLKQNQS